MQNDQQNWTETQNLFLALRLGYFFLYQHADNTVLQFVELKCLVSNHIVGKLDIIYYNLTQNGPDILIFKACFPVQKEEVKYYLAFFKVLLYPSNYRYLVLENTKIQNFIKILIKIFLYNPWGGKWGKRKGTY